ncbi:MAG: ATP-binding protein [Treponema sp.]|nr:ATP-binding protein [Treponema sp.]
MKQSIFKRLWAMVIPVQVFAVILAFALMVFFSYNFMSGIEHKHLLEKIDNIIKNTEDKIYNDLLESEATLGVVSETIRGMIMSGRNYENLRDYLFVITEYLMIDTKLVSDMLGFYGYFDAFDGRFCDSRGLTAPPDFDPQTRLWYTEAVKADGDVIVTEPFIDIDTNDVMLTFARRIIHDNGTPLGVVCLDIKLDKIKEYAVSSHVTEGGYGILFDGKFNVIAHPHPAFTGRHLSLMNDGKSVMEQLQKYGSISERKATDYNGNDSVVFFHRLNNGWYLAVMAYADKYYQSVREIGIILSVLGALMAVVLIAILLSVIAGRKKAEERTKIMLDSVPLATGFWDKELNIKDCNQETLNLFEAESKNEFINQFNSFSPDYQPDGRVSIEKGYEYLTKALKEGFYNFEWTHRKADGTLIPCEVSLVRVKIKDEFMICSYTRDLRDLKNLMIKMREADECTQVLFDATPLSCFMVDKNLKILETNQEVVRLFELSNKKEFIDQITSFFPEYQPSGRSSKDTLDEYLGEAFDEGFSRFEWMFQKLDGEQIPADVSLVRVKYRGEFAIAAYIRDLREIKNMISEMRRAEVAEESNKAKSDFLAKMSHEIRTPMNAIMGITEIQLQDNTLPLATKEALERIYNSGDLLLGIINDILDLSKIEAGKLELVTVNYDIASLIYDTVKLNIMRYESKPIDFKLVVNDKTPSSLVGDELRIKQILNNLLSNAFKYTQEGQVEFTLSAEKQRDGSKCSLVFRVSDTGQGMTAEQVRKLGDKFSRFNMEANRKTEGTGLGMNITRNLIQLMNGDIIVESTPGLGSVFTVRLPQDCLTSDTIGQDIADNLMKLNLKSTTKMRNAQITQEYMPYGRILVIDDVETNLYVARGLISPYGISIDTGLSGFEAIEKIKENSSYDIIFMDHMMPRMDGIEAVKIIRSLGYKKPIVALTANALQGQAEMFLNNGFDDFISKPIDIRSLNNVLNRFIRDKQTQETLNEARKQKNMLYASGSHNIAVDPQLAEFFVRDAKKAISVLSAISENNCRRVDDLSTFIINVHAMKSALANVGESDLASEASKLEQAGREHNTSSILLTLPEFIESLQTVIDKLHPEEDETSEETDDKAYLFEKLREITAACEALDKKAAKASLADLKQKTWSRNIRDQLSAIAKSLLHSDFEETNSIVQKITDENN